MTTQPEYRKLIPPRRVKLADDWGELEDRRVSVAAHAELLSLVLADVSDQAGVSIVMPREFMDVDENEQHQRVTLYLDSAGFRDVLILLGQSFGMEPVLRNGVVSWAAQAASELAVIPSGFVSVDEAREAARGVLGDSEGVKPIGGSLLVAGDSRSVQRAEELGSVLSAAEPEQWLISVWFVELSVQFAERFGVDVSMLATVEGLIGGDLAELVSQGVLSVFAEADQSQNYGRLLSKASLVLVEGRTSSVESVDAIPVPKRTVSPEGTVTTQEFEEVTAGLSLRVNGYSVPGGFLLELEPELSAVTGFVEEHPIIVRRALQSSCMVTDGEWIVLAGLNQWQDQTEHRGLFLSYESRDVGVRDVVVLLHCARVAGPTGREHTRPQIPADVSVMPDPMRPGELLIVPNERGAQ